MTVNLFVERGLVARQSTLVIRGSGVDETVFRPMDHSPSKLPVVLFAGRLLKQKGIGDFIEAARRPCAGKRVFKWPATKKPPAR